MKKIFNKTVVFVIGLLSVIGISVNTSNVSAAFDQTSSAKYDSVNETTPLFLFHGADLVAQNGSETNWHYSHSSHSSHSSHQSHVSHYSSRY